MISKLLIKNFQSHENSYLEFDKGVNIIVGCSDSGKTAIIRALRWLIWNRPSGTEMRSNWCEKDDVTCVKTWIHDGKSEHADREIYKGENKYHLYAQTFKAFGTSVPQELQEYFNLSEVNLQSQLDAPFLLSETPGKVAEYFNSVAKLSKIDTATQNINSWISELTSIIGKEATKDKPATGLIKQIKDGMFNLDKFKHLEKFEIDIEVLEDMNKKYLLSLKKQTKLENTINNIIEINSFIKEQEPLLELEPLINEILSLIELRAKSDLEEVKLDKLIHQITFVQSKIKTIQDLISIEIPLNDILKLYKELETTNKDIISLSKLLININNTVIALNTEKVLYDSLHTKFEKMFPEVCPLCGKKK